MPSSDLVSIPSNPFNGQIFIDAFRIKWEYDSEAACWIRKGSVTSFPEATSTDRGLLSAKLKTILDSIPEAGGHFSLIVDPKLSAVPFKHKALLKTKVLSTAKNDAGSEINISNTMAVDVYAGKAILFTSGILINKTLFIYSNSEQTIYVQGNDATQASPGDKFEIIEVNALNKDGLLLGDIVLASESLSLTFVDGNGDPIDGDCKIIRCDNAESPPGINIEVSDAFINEFCVQIPGCKGPKGNRGPKGETGAPGTGDGPKGEKGDKGTNAETAEKLSGVKINDITDIFDTAVVGVELDADSGKLHVIKARMKTPDSSSAADQVNASAISRDVNIKDDFTYEIVMPNGDPIGKQDVTILHYPSSFNPNNTTNVPDKFSVWNMSLSSLIDAIIAAYRVKLTEISAEYDAQIKPHILSIDKEARIILANLADDVARCESQLPIEFCLGIKPKAKDGGCNPEPTAAPDLIAGDILGNDFDDATTVVMPRIPTDLIPPPPPPPPSPPPPPTTKVPNDVYPEVETDPSNTYPNAPEYGEVPVPGRYSNITYATTPGVGGTNYGGVGRSGRPSHVSLLAPDGSTTLQKGTYIVKWDGGSGRSANGPHKADVKIVYEDEAGSNEVTFGEPDGIEYHNWDKSAYEAARKSAPIESNIVTFTLTTTGKASAVWTTDEKNPSGRVYLQPYLVLKADEKKNIPLPVTPVVVQGSVETTGGNGGGDSDTIIIPPCPECPECTPSLACGDCPSSPVPIYATSITPASIPNSTPTPVQIVGTGFVSPVTVTINGVSQTVMAQTITTIDITVEIVPPGTYNVEINMGDSATVCPNGLVVEP